MSRKILMAIIGGGTIQPPAPITMLRWSSPATWGGTLPAAGESFFVGADVLYDLAASPVGGYGTVTTSGGAIFFDTTKSQSFTAAGVVMDNGGGLVDGTLAAPRQWDKPLDIILTGSFASSGKTPRANGGFSRSSPASRGIVGMASANYRFEFFVEPRTYRTKINDHTAQGSAALTLLNAATGWKAGERLLIAPTQLFQNSLPEVIALASNVTSSAATLATPVAAHRFGKLQYVNRTADTVNAQGRTIKNAVMGYVDTGYRHANPLTPFMLDNRATVALMDRPTNITCPNDSDWITNNHGATVMLMSLSASVKIDGVRFSRGGQQDVQGGYGGPHWHNLSFNRTTGALIGDATGQYAKNCVVENSVNRGFVMHGTCGLTLDGNVAHDIRGQSFFMEDGVERRCFITNNIASLGKRTVNGGVSGGGLKAFETESAAGFWLTNPDNTVTGNEGFGMQGVGCWNSYAKTPFGDNVNVPVVPEALTVLLFENNSWHSNEEQGRRLELVVTNEMGNLSANAFQGGGAFTTDSIWKNRKGGYQNRIQIAIYPQWSVADNVGQDIFGAHHQETGGFIDKGLFVAQSLNTFEVIPTIPAVAARSGAASYHASNVFRDCALVGYQATPMDFTLDAQKRAPNAGGAITMWDFYTRPLENYHKAGTGVEYLSSHPGTLLPRPEWDVLGPTQDDALRFLLQCYNRAIIGQGAPTGFQQIGPNVLDVGEAGDNDFGFGWAATPADANRMAKFAYGIRSVVAKVAEGDTYIECRKRYSTDSDAVLAFDPVDYGGQGPLQSQMGYRVNVKTNGQVWFGSGAAADAPLPTPFAFSTFIRGNTVRLHRAAGGALTIQTSTDGNNFTLRHTFAATTVADLHRYIGVASSGVLANDVVREPRVMQHQFRRWPLQSAFDDALGQWAAPNSFLVPNKPYFTYGITTVPIAVGGCPDHVSTLTPFLGVESAGGVCDLVVRDPLVNYSPHFKVQRINPADDTVQGEWLIADSKENSWTPFRNFVMAANAEYIWRWPDNPVNTRVSLGGPKPFFHLFTLYGYSAAAGGMVLWLEWPASQTVRAFGSRSSFDDAQGTCNASTLNAGFGIAATVVASPAALRAATSFSIYKDAARNLVGLKYVGIPATALGAGASFTTSVIV